MEDYSYSEIYAYFNGIPFYIFIYTIDIYI
jgi:hypothetical protein